jgi:hypothetical protein
MSAMRYIEDIFLELADLVVTGQIAYWHADTAPILSFQQAVKGDNGITQRQADFMLKLVKKYRKEISKYVGEDITEHVDNPLWKKSFREIDYTKKISIKTEADGKTYVHIQFPFSLKDNFLKEFNNSRTRPPTVWDNDQKVQKALLFDINLIQLYDYGKKNEFEFSEDFINLVEQIEEIWSDADELVPHCITDNEKVYLVNANDNAKNYFETHQTDNFIKNLFLAKTMGYPLAKNQEKSEIFKILTTKDTKFWSNDLKKIISLIKDLDAYPVVIFLDRTDDVKERTKEIFWAFQAENFPTDGVRVCFRFLNEDPDGVKFNQWIKDSKLGGSVESGNIFICQHKPPKWMLKSNFSPKIVISNSLYPQTNTAASSIVNNHHTVFYIGKVKPSTNRDTKIVEL